MTSASALIRRIWLDYSLSAVFLITVGINFTQFLDFSYGILSKSCLIIFRNFIRRIFASSNQRRIPFESCRVSYTFFVVTIIFVLCISSYSCPSFSFIALWLIFKFCRMPYIRYYNFRMVPHNQGSPFAWWRVLVYNIPHSNAYSPARSS